MAQHRTITEHQITYAEAVSLAWMLDLVAARSREMGCPDAAGGFEACAATFRQSVAYSLDSIVEMTESTIRNLSATVTPWATDSPRRTIGRPAAARRGR